MCLTSSPSLAPYVYMVPCPTGSATGPASQAAQWITGSESGEFGWPIVGGSATTHNLFAENGILADGAPVITGSDEYSSTLQMAMGFDWYFRFPTTSTITAQGCSGSSCPALGGGTFTGSDGIKHCCPSGGYLYNSNGVAIGCGLTPQFCPTAPLAVSKLCGWLVDGTCLNVQQQVVPDACCQGLPWGDPTTVIFNTTSSDVDGTDRLSSSSGSRLSTLAIVLIAVGGAVLILSIVAAAAFLWHRRSKSRRCQETAEGQPGAAHSIEMATTTGPVPNHI
jgi:hypothetical protein